MACTKEQLEQIYSELRECGERCDKELGNAALEAEFAERSKKYDAAKAEFDAEGKARERSEARQKLLAEIEANHKASTNDKRIGFDDSKRCDANPENIAARHAEDCRLVMHGIGIRANRHHSVVSKLELTERHREAAKRLNVDLNAESWDIPLAGFRMTAPPIWASVNGTQLSRESRTDAPMYIAGSNVGSQFVPQGFSGEFEKKMVAYDGPRSVARIVNTASGNSLPWPTVDDTGNSGALLTETTSMADALAAATGAITFAAYKYESKPIQVSAELFEDSFFDMGSLVGELLGERIGRIEGSQHTTGTGSSQPKGIVTCATAGVTAAGATSIEGDDLLGLIHSLDPAYRRNNPNVGFMMHDNILLHLRKKKDGNGQYLWQPSLQMGVPDRLLGYPVSINQNMQSSVATATVTVLFADFSKFIIRDVGTVRLYRLDELYRAKDMTGFCAFHRTDSNTIATVAIRKLTQA